MRYVIGWLTVKPGKRDELLALGAPVFAKTRQEDGCLFYECHPSADDPDQLLIVEGWAGREQHEAHQKAPHHVAFGPDVVRLSLRGRFEEIDAASVSSVRPEFAT